MRFIRQSMNGDTRARAEDFEDNFLEIRSKSYEYRMFTFSTRYPTHFIIQSSTRFVMMDINECTRHFSVTSTGFSPSVITATEKTLGVEVTIWSSLEVDY